MKRVKQTVFGCSASFQWFLSAYGQWHRERGCRGKGLRLRPRFTGSATAPGAHGETLSRPLIVPYLPLSLSQNFSLSLFHPSCLLPLRIPHPGLLFSFHMQYHALQCICMCVYTWVLRSSDTLWSALTVSSLPSEECSFSLIPMFYSCTRHYPSILNTCTVHSKTRPGTLIKHWLSLAAAVTLLYLVKKRESYSIPSVNYNYGTIFVRLLVPVEAIFEANMPVFLLRTGPHKSPKIIAHFHFFNVA